jgi:hypothetical protein
MSKRKNLFGTLVHTIQDIKKYTVDKIIEALHFVLFNTYVQFGGYVFEQNTGIPMGGNASPLIADLYLAWCEFSYISNLKKSDFQLAKVLSYNSRYIDDILVLNCTEFGNIAKLIYAEELILEKSNSSTIQDTFLDLHIRIINKSFRIGIYHKVDDFNFEVINFPFLESNIDSSLGYKTFYSQLVRYYRLCNNLRDFNIRTKMIFSKLVGRGYASGLLKKYFFRFCSKYPNVLQKFFVDDATHLWESCISFKRPNYINIKCEKDIKACVKPVKVMLTDIYGHLKKPFKLKQCSVSLNEPMSQNSVNKVQQISTNKVQEKVGMSPIEINISQDRTQPIEINISQDRTQPIICFTPTGIKNPSNHCYVNSVLQTILCILWHDPSSFDYINSSNEGTLVSLFQEVLKKSVCIESLKMALISFMAFFDGRIQRDCNECYFHLLNILHLGTRYSLLDDNFDEDSLVTSLPKKLFTITILEELKCTRCHYSSVNVSSTNILTLNLKPSYNLTSLILDSVTDKFDKTCHLCNDIILHHKSASFNDLPPILALLINRFVTHGPNARKNQTLVTIEKILKIDSAVYELVSIVHHHGDYISSGHYTSIVRYAQFYNCNDSQIKKTIKHSSDI